MSISFWLLESITYSHVNVFYLKRAEGRFPFPPKSEKSGLLLHTQFALYTTHAQKQMYVCPPNKTNCSQNNNKSV